ncbi:hypothetical protein APHAL10511_003269 [Amanita phalloides]|nr:hypothetical protein APHAL10511_003269 [Amanita phalloides]
MTSKPQNLPGRTTRQLRSRSKLYEDDISGAVILVTPSATGKGIHKRWKYSDSPASNIRKVMPTEKKAAVRPLKRELTVLVDGAFTDRFNRSLSASEQLPPAIKSSTALLENDTGSPVVKLEEDDMHGTLRESSCDQDIPSRVVLNPEESDTGAVMRRMMEQEQRIEDTFQVQWQKMLDRRQDALRSIEAWSQTGEVKNSVRGRTITRNWRPQSRANRRRKGSKKAKPRGRRLGPCGTILIDMDDEYKSGLSTSAPPVYPPEWVTRKLTGRESTESIE